MSKVGALRGKRFHYAGRDEHGGRVLTECTPEKEGLVVTLDDPKPGQPLRMGEEMCNLRQRDDGHYEVADLAEGDGGGGPPKVASKAYRDGWDLVFGRGSKSKSKSKSN